MYENFGQNYEDDAVLARLPTTHLVHKTHKLIDELQNSPSRDVDPKSQKERMRRRQKKVGKKRLRELQSGWHQRF